jgi:hypothetical protein
VFPLADKNIIPAPPKADILESSGKSINSSTKKRSTKPVINKSLLVGNEFNFGKRVYRVTHTGKPYRLPADVTTLDKADTLKPYHASTAQVVKSTEGDEGMYESFVLYSISDGVYDAKRISNPIYKNMYDSTPKDVITREELKAKESNNLETFKDGSVKLVIPKVRYDKLVTGSRKPNADASPSPGFAGASATCAYMRQMVMNDILKDPTNLRKLRGKLDEFNSVFHRASIGANLSLKSNYAAVREKVMEDFTNNAMEYLGLLFITTQPSVTKVALRMIKEQTEKDENNQAAEVEVDGVDEGEEMHQQDVE